MMSAIPHGVGHNLPVSCLTASSRPSSALVPSDHHDDDPNRQLQLQMQHQIHQLQQQQARVAAAAAAAAVMNKNTTGKC
jgi:hypothetical protein